MASGPTLSACMIVKNEAHQLAEALACLQPFVDEIVVVDTGSCDDSKAVARSFTPHVIDFEWCDDFAAARNISLEHASCDYILWVDADDRIDEVSQERLRGLKGSFDGETGFYLILQDMDAAGPSHCLFQIRCVPRRNDVRFRGKIHEHLMVEGLRLTQTDILIQHHGYKDQALLRRKIQRNLAILEKELSEGRDDVLVHFYLALSYDHLGRAAEAISAMEKALDLMERKQVEGPIGKNGEADISPFVPEAYLLLADVYTKRGQTEKAVRHMTKASAFAANNAHVYHKLGDLYQEMGEHVRALALYGKALHGDQLVSVIPRKPLIKGKVYVAMAFSAFCLKQEDLAREYLSYAWTLGVPVHEGWEELGHKAMDLKAFTSAMWAYKEASRNGELSADGLSNLGLLYSKQDRVRDSLRCYEAALKKSPTNLAALTNLAHLRLKLGHVRTAGAMYRRLMDEGGKDWSILLGAALAAAREKDDETLMGIVSVLKAQWPEAPSGSATRSGFFTELAGWLESQGKGVLAGWARECGALPI